jgi:hypothetical protein
VAKTPHGFVPLRALKQGPADPRAALAEIRAIYFATTKQTIEVDFAHAIALLQSIPDEDDRERASVYMQGLNEMRREWAKRAKAKARGAAPQVRDKRPPKP